MMFHGGQQIERACATIDAALNRFSFVDECDRMSALALLLTARVSDLRGPRPLFFVAGPPASGKTSLVNFAHRGTGREDDLAPLHLPAHEHEMRKVVTAVLRAGDPLAHFDNMTENVTSSTLAALGTSNTFATRELGESGFVVRSQQTTWVVTLAGDARVSRDLSRRAVWVELRTPHVRRAPMTENSSLASALSVLFEGLTTGRDSPIATSVHSVWETKIGGAMRRAGYSTSWRIEAPADRVIEGSR